MKDTKKALTLFQDNVLKFMAYFSLMEWEPVVAIVDNDDIRGQCRTDPPARIAYFDLGKSWITQQDPPEIEIRRTAFHEVLELLLIELRSYADESTNDEIVDGAIHRVIRIFENTIFYIVDKGGK